MNKNFLRVNLLAPFSWKVDDIGKRVKNYAGESFLSTFRGRAILAQVALVAGIYLYIAISASFFDALALIVGFWALLLLWAGTLYFTYKGKRWAIWITIVLISLAIIFNFLQLLSGDWAYAVFLVALMAWLVQLYILANLVKALKVEKLMAEALKASEHLLNDVSKND